MNNYVAIITMTELINYTQKAPPLHWEDSPQSESNAVSRYLARFILQHGMRDQNSVNSFQTGWNDLTCKVLIGSLSSLGSLAMIGSVAVLALNPPVFVTGLMTVIVLVGFLGLATAAYLAFLNR